MPVVEIHGDARFQERFWAIERIAWTVFGLFIFAALLGLTGQGGLFGRATTQGKSATLDYPRISRMQAIDEFAIGLQTPAAEAKILIDGRFLALFDIQSIQPAPAREAAEDGGLSLAFNVTTDTPVEVTVRARAKKPALSGEAASFVVNGESLRLRPVILP